MKTHTIYQHIIVIHHFTITSLNELRKNDHLPR